MLRQVYLAAFGALALMASAMPASAQSRMQQWAYCANEGNAYSTEVQISGCSAVIQAGRENDLNLAIAYLNRGDGYHTQRDYVRALADYNESIRLNPRDVFTYNSRGALYRLQGEYGRALTDYNEAVRLDPNDAVTYYNRAITYAAQEDYVRAIADYDQALRINPQYTDALNNRGNIYARREDYSRAMSDFERALEIDPQHWRALSNRGDVYFNRGDYLRAIADYDRAAELQPDRALRHNERCWARSIAVIELDVARQACTRAVELAPDEEARADYLDSRGLVGLKQQRWQDAWNDYNAANSIVPHQAHYLFGRGVAALRLGRDAEGRADIAAAIAADAEIATTYEGYGVTP